MKGFVIITLLTGMVMVACQTQLRVRKLVNSVDSLDQALALKEKYPGWETIIHKLDSGAFFNHRIYSQLRAGQLFQTGVEESNEAYLYKLIEPNDKTNDSTFYYVLQIHFK